MASPKPKPAKLKVLEGRGHGRDSGGRPVQEPPSFKRIPPTAPDDLTGYAAELWNQIVPELGRLDLLKEIDEASIRACCECFARYREAVRLRQEHGLTVQAAHGIKTAPWVSVEESAGKEFRGWCSEFGLTPSAESRLNHIGNKSDEQESNPFSGTG